MNNFNDELLHMLNCSACSTITACKINHNFTYKLKTKEKGKCF